MGTSARVIFKSVGKYKTERVDPLTGEKTEFEVQTPAGANGSIEYGAFMTPRQSTSTSLSSNDTNGSTSNSSTNTVIPDKAKATADAQQADQQVAGKEAQSPPAEQVKIDQEFAKKEEEIAENSTPANDSVKGNTYPGFDKKTGKYTVQNTQTLKVKSKSSFSSESGNSVNIPTSSISKITVPKGTILFRDSNKKEGSNLIIFVNQTQEPNAAVSKGNKITATCARNEFKYTDGGSFENVVFLDVIKKVFCNGKTDKTWAELTA